MKKTAMVAMCVAGACVLATGCRTNKGNVQPDAALSEGPKSIEIVEPEGVNLSDVVSFHGLGEYKPYYYYNAEMPPEAMRLYRHRYVELDGEAPAEVILTMVRKTDLDMLEHVDELPHYTSVLHYVYTFREDKKGTLLGTFSGDLMNPYSTLSLRVTPVELDEDGRQELLLTDETSYYMPLQLFELREGEGRIQDVIWSSPEARSFVPFDHDRDGTLDLVAIPSADIISGLINLYTDKTPRAPFVLARDDQGFWHEQPLRRPFESWAAMMLTDYMERNDELSYAMLEGIKAYSKVIDFTFPEEVYAQLLARYEQLEDPFERALMIMSMPVASAEVVNRVCTPVLEAGDSLEQQAACFAALGDEPTSPNRDLILEFYPEFQRKMSEYPQLHQSYHQVQKFYALPMWISQAFEQHKDDRFLKNVLARATQNVDDQTFYMRTGELYPLLQWSYDEEIEEHRFVLDVFFERIRETIESGRGYEARVLFEPINSSIFGMLGWYHQELERQKKGEVVDPDTIARGKAAQAVLDREMPPELVEPLIASVDPQLRILAIHYFASTDIERFATLLRTRIDVETDDVVRQEMLGRLYVLTEDDSLSKAFWRAQIVKALASANQQDQYASYSMLPYFMGKATPAEIESLWDEVSSDDFRQQILWQLPVYGDEDLSAERWAGVRERVLDFYKRSVNANYRSNVIYTLSNMKTPQVATLLREVATNEQDIYVVQAAIQGLLTMKDEQALELLRLREQDLREQQYIYSSLLFTASESLPEESTALLIKELEAQDPTQPMESQLLWTVGGMMYRDGKPAPKAIIDWIKRDVDAGLKVPVTSCIRLGQQVMMLFLAEDKGWEEVLSKVEAHPDCKGASTPYVARKFAVDAAISMSYQPEHQSGKLYSFIRQHHDFPYRPIRVSVAQFERRLEEMAEEKKKQAQKKGQPQVP